MFQSYYIITSIKILGGFSGTYCQNSNACNNNPCMNGGTCQPTSSGYICLCQNFFKGTNCEICKIVNY